MVDTPRPGEPFGGYRIVRRIGHGGMGTVFEAVQENLGRSVALKVLLPQFSDEQEFRTRFAREARALAALDSPHVIQVHDHGEAAGQLFIATQLVHGSDLQKQLTERGVPPVDTALDLVAQVASGLADAHAAGVLHRDIKPSNVLVREGHGDVHAYLCDLGIARAEGDDHTLTTGVAGTVGYMAPERHSGAPATVQSDLYSLGCLLWVLVSGDVPYAGNSGVQMALAHMHQPVPALAGETPVGDAINAILRRSMDKEPQHRYASAVEMRRDLLAARATARSTVAIGTAETTLRPVADATELRGAGPVAPAPSARPRRRRTGTLLLAGGVLVVGAMAGAGVALAGAGEDPDAGSRPSDASSSAPPSAQPDDTQVSDDTQASDELASSDEATPTPSDEPTTPASSPSSTPEPASATTQPASPAPTPDPTVTCWDGGTAASRAECGLPSGAAGLQTVFPSMSGCTSTPPTVAGKAEVYVCGYGDFLIRYTRWDQGYDRYAYLDSTNQVDGAEWYAAGEFAGRQWTSFEDDPGEKEPYQWSASYRYSPYSVSVEGTSAEARDRGVALVQAAAPSRVGLR